ncbi:MAG: ABC transporter permease [Thermoplasmata archaeon]|nr:ABC transporter permease [Thermoplasmata archaeon]
MDSFRKVLAKRIFNAFLAIILIMLINFLLFRVMPGDPALMATPRLPGDAAEAIYERNVELMGLDQPLHVQLYKYFVQTFMLEWGESYKHELPVTTVVANSIMWTMLLLGVSSFLTFVIGIKLGKMAANRRGKPVDVTITSFGLFFYGMPVFWFAIVLMVVFAVWIPAFPLSGYMDPGMHPGFSIDAITNILWHMTLPVATLTIGALAGIILIQRNSLVDVLTEEYIVTAYAKGLSEKQVMKGHATPNARLPVVTTIAMDIAFILGGAFQVEYVFSYKGIGWVTIDAINDYDYPILQFIVLIGGVAVVLANLLADIVLVKLDPRVTIT